MLRTIYFYGGLRDKFGPSIELDVASVAEAGRALCVVLPDFRKEIVDKSFRIVAGAKRKGFPIGEAELAFNLGRRHKAIHITPIIRGAGGRGGVMKAVMGVALIGAAFAFAPAVVGALGPTMGMGSTAIGLGSLGAITYGNIAMFGVSMLLGGVSQMLAPQQKTSSQAQDQANSYISAGPTNIAQQGAVVPLVYGEVRAGSVLVSNGVSNTRLEDDDDDDDDDGGK